LRKEGFVMRRKLFCEYGPLAYWISTQKCRLLRHARNFFSSQRIAKSREAAPLPLPAAQYAITLVREGKGFDPRMEHGKAANIALGAEKVTGVVIKPGETFSFWALVGRHTAKKGYQAARTLKYNKPTQEVGGGLCHVTNLIHYLALQTMLTVTEHHDHDWVDLNPEAGRQVPFGTGTSVMYNYKDLRLSNRTDITYQILLRAQGNLLHGEIRSDRPQAGTWKIESLGCHFSREADGVYRNGQVVRHLIDTESGEILAAEEVKRYHAKLIYDLELTNPAR